ncbi:hypothetical protein [Burkholderia lata]|uniref:Wadjet protein JetD C-terminal domain-containing protein n=1 Tax=Burkholderia lata (strain ATCC 17760 / DSM 23089 / LMG 22485 / NCIMB 9086 / R18194 / 383) TaxID=482957 RepID=Q39PN1_BURL3|nr:hypothetical protein [Burkholderia lata]ABB05585.1 hypothetical protein Bcep18194_C6534 [Burkholderia lata]
MAAENIEKLVNVLRQQTRKSTVLQGGTLIDRLTHATGLDAAAIRAGFKDMRTRGWIEASSWSGTGNPVGRVKVNLPPLPPPSWAEGWKDALITCERLSDSDRDALFECGASLADMDASEFPKILDGLIRLREDQLALAGSPAYLVSARYLRGSSKMLSKLGARAIKAFGIDLSRFPYHPPYVITAGASNPEAVVLVENPAAFELAVTTSAIEHCAFIATFGFGLSKASEDFGNQLAGMVEEYFYSAVTLVREGSRTPSARELLNHPNITFWGDLDIAGMEIHERIAKRHSHVRLSALYGPMLEAVLVEDNRHPYVSAVGKSGQAMFRATRSDALAMLRYCNEWAADQELVTANQIEEFAGKPLAI